MKKRPSRNRSAFAAVLFAAVLASGSYALTAGNTVPDTRAGDGDGDVTGYVVSTINYALDATDPSLADAVSFVLDIGAEAAPAVVKAQLAGTWYTCAADAVSATENDYDCTLGGGINVADITTLRVVAAQ